MLNAVDHPYITGKGGRKANNGVGSMQVGTLFQTKQDFFLSIILAYFNEQGRIIIGFVLFKIIILY